MAAIAIPIGWAIEGATILEFLTAVGGAVVVSLGIGAAQQIAQGNGRQETGADPEPELDTPSPSDNDYPSGTPPVEKPWETQPDLPRPEPGWIRY